MKSIFKYLLIVPFLVSILLSSCNEPDPEQIVISADIPKSVSMQMSILEPDTFKFKIKTYETDLDSIKLYEENTNYVSLKPEDIGANKTKFDLYLLYSPNSIGVKNFELVVISDEYRKSYCFSVEVLE